MTSEEARELGALYAVGALDEESARELKEKFEELPGDLRHEILEWQEVASLLPLGLEQPEVPAHIRGRLIAVATSRTSARGGSDGEVIQLRRARGLWSPVGGYLLMAASIILALVTVILYLQNKKLTIEMANLNRELETRTGELQAERRERDEVVARSTRMVALNGDVAAPDASARVFWDTDRQEWVIYFFNLPAAPSDKDYQLWYITHDQRKVSALVFGRGANGRVKLRVALPHELVSALAATAVTLEPRGGSPQPTGQLVLKGAI